VTWWRTSAIVQNARRRIGVAQQHFHRVSFAKIGEARNAGRLAPVDGIESGKDMRSCTF
jgi:hypothetical protein